MAIIYLLNLVPIVPRKIGLKLAEVSIEIVRKNIRQMYRIFIIIILWNYFPCRLGNQHDIDK